MGKGVRVGMFLVAMLILLGVGINGEIKSQKELLEVQRRLKILNKPPIKSIKSEDGDIIDCVDIYKQPAFDHPALKSHTIQMSPSFNLLNRIKTNQSATTVIPQKWQKTGTCPKGTIPIRRNQEGDLFRARSFESYGRKNQSVRDTKTNTTKPIRNNVQYYFPQENVSLSYLLTQGYSYIGAQADINLWNPHLESNDEYSSGQIWLRNGPPNFYESVESGWVVNPIVYGDRQTRFFAYWTADSSKSTGCFDLTCPGFVQTSHEIALGASFDAVSQERGNQYHTQISLYLDPKTKHWWLQCQGINVGYWPGEFFSLLNRNALYVMFGGEVYSPRIRKTPHTSTHMGSGYWPEGLFQQACFIRHIRVMDYSCSWKFPEWIYAGTDEEYCYRARLNTGYTIEPEFYFGGPGQNPTCP
ncbi:hypothetical protein ACHQM5_001947 [Ranunculus cassubicifolius]